MKRNEEPKNPYLEVALEIADLLLTMHDVAIEHQQNIKQSEEWKKGYASAISGVIIGMTEAYMPTLKERSDKWEAASNNLLKIWISEEWDKLGDKKNFETN